MQVRIKVPVYTNTYTFYPLLVFTTFKRLGAKLIRMQLDYERPNKTNVSSLSKVKNMEYLAISS